MPSVRATKFLIGKNLAHFFSCDRWILPDQMQPNSLKYAPITISETGIYVVELFRTVRNTLSKITNGNNELPAAA